MLLVIGKALRRYLRDRILSDVPATRLRRRIAQPVCAVLDQEINKTTATQSIGQAEVNT